jgi:hypothetical protein
MAEFNPAVPPPIMATSVEIFLTSVFMTHLVLLIFVRESVLLHQVSLRAKPSLLAL